MISKKLGVNVDHVATLRQARKGFNPDPVEAAKLCQKAGAHSVVMHLREDRRHIQESDLFRAEEILSIKLNLEMALAPSVVKIAAKLCPEQVTLVPEKRMEMTTESGLNLLKHESVIRHAAEIFKKKKIIVSFFIDPDFKQVEAAKKLGADAVEFHTGSYANVKSRAQVEKELRRLKKAIALARQLQMSAHAGHGLDYANVRPISAIEGIEELNIGYSIVARAIWVGFERSVKEMLGLMA